MNSNVIAVSEQSFATEVIEKSKDVPVVVDFWADWCGPCRSLGPILERLAVEAGGSWILAKVDVDANPRLAQAFGIQGIPAVRGWRDGREVAEFVGALPEAQVRKWLEQLGPTQSEITLLEAEEALSAGEDDKAQSLLKEVLTEEPGNDRAKSLLERLEMSQRAGVVDEAEVRARLESNPSDAEAAIQLADLLASRGDLQEAFSILIGVVRESSGDEREKVRMHLLKVLDTVPADDPRAMKARRELSLVLF
jgi:putative thioredoxin